MLIRLRSLALPCCLAGKQNRGRVQEAAAGSVCGSCVVAPACVVQAGGRGAARHDTTRAAQGTLRALALPQLSAPAALKKGNKNNTQPPPVRATQVAHAHQQRDHRASETSNVCKGLLWVEAG